MTTFRIGTWNLEYAAGPDKNRQRLSHLLGAGAGVWGLIETHDDIDLSWSHYVMHLQLAEWPRLCVRFPDAPLVVAGDLKMSLGGTHSCGVRLSDHSELVVEVTHP
jgi:hypothetical protein